MDWIQLVLTPVLTGVEVYFVQLYWQETNGEATDTILEASRKAS